MRTILALLLIPFLAACGADGDPIRPTANASVTANSDGVYVSQNLRLDRGPFSLSLGLGL
jgi:nitrous oxide reductase accessory protein NosL